MWNLFVEKEYILYEYKINYWLNSVYVLYFACIIQTEVIVVEKKFNPITNQSNINNQLIRGEIYYADLGDGIGCEQKGLRPVLVIQNDKGNQFSKTTIIAPITSKTEKTKIPTHINISKEDSMLSRDSTVLMEQIRIIDKLRIRGKVGKLDELSMKKINAAICISLELVSIAC